MFSQTKIFFLGFSPCLTLIKLVEIQSPYMIKSLLSLYLWIGFKCDKPGVNVIQINGLLQTKSTPFYRRRREGGFKQVRNFIAIASFIVAVTGGLNVMLNKNKDKQTMASIVGIVFLISFFIFVSKGALIIYQASCLVTFAMAILGSVVAMYSDEKARRDGAIVTGIISLVTSLFILFTYLEFRLF